jgi:hypothetical protein
MKTSRLQRIMSQELPTISAQKRLLYRTDLGEVKYLFKILNQEIFNNELSMPEFEILARCREYWGMCQAKHFIPNLNSSRSGCLIRLQDKWYCKQWLINTLAHEMCHQYQWDVISKKRVRKGMRPIMSHGPTFFVFRDKLAKHGIALKRANSTNRWFKHQNLLKC